MQATPRKRRPKICRLTSVARCGVEIGKLYRLMRYGEITTSDGKRMVESLLAMKSCLEVSDLETRLKAIEAAIIGKQPSAQLLTFPKTEKSD
jgi:hypothetical protein